MQFINLKPEKRAGEEKEETEKMGKSNGGK